MAVIAEKLDTPFVEKAIEISGGGVSFEDLGGKLVFLFFVEFLDLDVWWVADHEIEAVGDGIAKHPFGVKEVRVQGNERSRKRLLGRKTSEKTEVLG